MFIILDEVLGIQEIKDKSVPITIRKAVRAVVLKDNKILMVHTNRGDYKFPGGGVKKQESLEEALIREVAEETGYIVKNRGTYIGKIIQRSINQFDLHGIFEMKSYYYYCEVRDIPQEQHLDKYEEDQEFTPVWITLDEVIAQNEIVLENKEDNINPWVYRETLALKYIRENVLK